MDGYPPEKQAMSLAERRVAEAFVLAMRAELSDAPYGAPFAAQPTQPEWVIVSRWGLSAEYLSLSRTGRPAPWDGMSEGRAPDNLQPRETFFGVRTAGPALEPCFLLLRHLPPDMPVAGMFLPTDGFVRLVGPTGGLRLVAAGRHAHMLGRSNGRAQCADVPCPPEGADGARAWSITAQRRPWLGEFVERSIGATVG
jgi:hypothetical protein